jgi:hypothetical protein
MLMSTIIAVALGMAPINPDGTVSGDYSKIIGRYSQSVDNRGKTYVHGFHAITGAPYELTMDRDGNVEATVGELIVNFQVKEGA